MEGPLPAVPELAAGQVCLVLEQAPALPAPAGLPSLKREEHGDTLEVIFKGRIPGVKAAGLVLGA